MIDENGNFVQPRFDDPHIAEIVMKYYNLGHELLHKWGYQVREEKTVDKNEK